MSKTDQTFRSRFKTGFHPDQAAFYSTEAILTGVDGRLLVDAQSLQKQAQASRSEGNVQSWGVPVDGVKECSNCSTVSVVAVPSGTKIITIQFGLMPGTERALLFLTSVFSRG